MTACQKCNSKNVYTQDGEYACMMCGKRWPVNGSAIIIQKGQESDMAAKRKKECRNCGRLKVLPADGLCGACYAAVHGKHEKGTLEYNAALADAKIRLNDQDKKPAPHIHRVCLRKRPGPAHKKSTTDVTVRKQPDADPAMAHIISILHRERLSLMAKADKITQALDLLDV